MKRCIVRAWAIVAILLALLVAIPPGTLFANGVPVAIPLQYYQNISNWGATSAKGTAIVGLAAGLVDVEVQGLSALPNGQYQVWIVSAQDGVMYEAGKFNTDDTGYAHFQVNLSEERLPYREYQLVLLTVEDEPDPSPNPDVRRSLVGFFAKYRPPAPTATPIPTPTPLRSPTPARPVFLLGTPTVTTTPTPTLTLVSGGASPQETTATTPTQPTSTPSLTALATPLVPQRLPVTGAPSPHTSLGLLALGLGLLLGGAALIKGRLAH